jgi:hypothetical protein
MPIRLREIKDGHHVMPRRAARPPQTQCGPPIFRAGRPRWFPFGHPVEIAPCLATQLIELNRYAGACSDTIGQRGRGPGIAGYRRDLRDHLAAPHHPDRFPRCDPIEAASCSGSELAESDARPSTIDHNEIGERRRGGAITAGGHDPGYQFSAPRHLQRLAGQNSLEIADRVAAQLAKSDQFSDVASPCSDNHIQTITVRTVSIKGRRQQVRRIAYDGCQPVQWPSRDRSMKQIAKYCN